MMRTCHSIHFLFMIVISSRCFSPLSSVIVSHISYIAFIIIQLMIKPCLCYFPVWPFTTGKWPINPYNPPCFDTDGHFAPKAWSLELVAVPFRVERNGFLDPKVCTINSNSASLMRISHHMSVLKLNLYHKQCK